MVTIGVIGDTHVPDRVRQLHPDVLPAFETAGVEVILHTGDVSSPGVLRQLESVAPVLAVRGNRDWVALRHLPLKLLLPYEEVTIGITHGHGDWGQYFREKVLYMLRGPQSFRFFTDRAVTLLPPDVDVVVFGHNHSPLNLQENGKLLFNPGSPAHQVPPSLPPSVGILHIGGQQVQGEIVYLRHWNEL